MIREALTDRLYHAHVASTRSPGGDQTATTARLASRSVTRMIVSAAGRCAELVPPRTQRSGTPLAVGAARIAFAGLRGLLAAYRVSGVALGPDSTVTVDLRTPQGRRIYGYGFREPAALVMQSLLREGDVVIDGGANIGLYTVLAAARVGRTGCVVSCEPSPATMALLRESVARNRMHWVRLREVALAEAPGRMRMHVFEPGSGYSSFAPEATTSGSEIEVEVTTIDELAAGLDRPVSLVKLDIEGAELRALRGAVGLLEGPRPIFIIELEPAHLSRQDASVGDVQELFEDAGYVGYGIHDRLVPLSGSWERPRGDPNIVLCPREREQI